MSTNIRQLLTFMSISLFIGCGNAEFSHLPHGQTAYTGVEQDPTPNTNDPIIEDDREFCSPIECGLHDGVNAYRDDIGLTPLSLVARISEISRVHSEDMANGIVSFGHAGFLDRIDELSADFEIVAAAENVATNQGHSDPISVALGDWLDSEGHRDNMEGVFTATGVGVAQDSEGSYYFTQIYLLVQD